MYNYNLFEDNAGCLHLAVLDDAGACVWYLTDPRSSLVLQALAELRAGGDPIADDWEGGEDDPSVQYAAICDMEDARNGGVREIDKETVLDMLFDFRCGIDCDFAGYAQSIEPISYWWNASVSDNMPIYSIGGSLYCAYGWNGESYLKAFRVIDRFTAADKEKHELSPIYRYQDENREPDEDNDDDSDIVGFYVY